MAAAEAKKEEGNDLVKAQRYTEAIAKYSEAIALYPASAVFYSNRAAAYSMDSQHEKAIADCQEGFFK